MLFCEGRNTSNDSLETNNPRKVEQRAVGQKNQKNLIRNTEYKEYGIVCVCGNLRSFNGTNTDMHVLRAATLVNSATK